MDGPSWSGGDIPFILWMGNYLCDLLWAVDGRGMTMRISVGLFPGVRLSVSLERPASVPPFAVALLANEPGEALPDRVSWSDGYIYRIVAGRMVVDRLSENEAKGLDSLRSELFQAQSHQN
jgi:hypothetical protein